VELREQLGSISCTQNSLVLFERIFSEPLKIYHGLSFFFLRAFFFFLSRKKEEKREIYIKRTFNRKTKNFTQNNRLIKNKNIYTNKKLLAGNPPQIKIDKLANICYNIK